MHHVSQLCTRRVVLDLTIISCMHVTNNWAGHQRRQPTAAPQNPLRREVHAARANGRASRAPRLSSCSGAHAWHARRATEATSRWDWFVMNSNEITCLLRANDSVYPVKTGSLGRCRCCCLSLLLDRVVIISVRFD